MDNPTSQLSPTEIERLVTPVQQRIVHDANVATVVLIAVGALTTLVALSISVLSYRASILEAAGLALLIFIFLGLAPAMLVRMMIRTRLRLGPKILTSGARTLVRVKLSSSSTRGRLTLQWESGGLHDEAAFEVDDLDANTTPEPQLYVHKNERWVAVILNDRLYIPLRNGYVRDYRR
jgi:hypothetical protein